MNPLKIIIVDDEESARGTLKALLGATGEVVDIIGEAANVKDGIELVKKSDFDLLFLDIQMPDGTGFNLLESCTDYNFEVVFTTAFDKYAIRAFDFSAIGYLLKPINIEELENALIRVKSISDKKQNNKSDQIELLQEIFKSQEKKLENIAVPTVDGFEIIKLDELVRCEGDRNYTNFVLSDGSSFLSSKTLKKYEDLLKDDRFLRIHKSHLINLKHVRRYIKGDGGSVEMSDGAVIHISREKKEAFNKYFSA